MTTREHYAPLQAEVDDLAQLALVDLHLDEFLKSLLLNEPAS